MAHHPLSFPANPWGFRIGIPALVWAMPTPPRGTFVVASVLFLGVAAALVYTLATRFVGEGRGASAVAVFACSGAGAITVSNPFLVDPAVYVVVAAALILALDQRLIPLAVLLSAAVFVHESSLYVLVPAVLLAFHGRGRRAALITAATGVPALFTYVVLHKTSLFVSTGDTRFSYLGELRHVAPDEIRSGGAKPIADALFYSFGAAWAAALFAFRRAERQVQLLASILVPLLFSMLLASDWTRVLTWSFPAVACLTATLAFARPTVAVFCATVLADSLFLPRLSPGFGKYLLVAAAFLIGAVIAFRVSRRPGSILVEAPR